MLQTCSIGKENHFWLLAREVTWYGRWLLLIRFFLGIKTKLQTLNSAAWLKLLKQQGDFFYLEFIWTFVQFFCASDFASARVCSTSSGDLLEFWKIILLSGLWVTVTSVSRYSDSCQQDWSQTSTSLYFLAMSIWQRTSQLTIFPLRTGIESWQLIMTDSRVTRLSVETSAFTDREIENRDKSNIDLIIHRLLGVVGTNEKMPHGHR